MLEALEPRVLLSATPILTQHVVLDPNAPSSCTSQTQTTADGIVVLDETGQADNAAESVTTVNPTADTSEFTSLSPTGTDPTFSSSDSFAVTALNQEVLQPIVSEAINRLTSLGFQSEQLDALHNIQVEIVDLPAWMLGTTTSNGIAIDQDGAGYGWFIDPTPSDDAEFTAQGSQLTASQGSVAQNKIDLLTVVAHELGHYLGLPDIAVNDGSLPADADVSRDVLMEGGTTPGVRRIEAQPLGAVSAIEAGAPRIDSHLTITPTISWNVNGSGFWDVASNWLDSNGIARLPTATDDVLIDRGSANPVITIRSGAQAVHSLLSAESLVLSGGSLTLSADSEIDGSFTETGGTLGGAGTLTVTGLTTLSGGQLLEAGTLVTQGALTINGNIGLDTGHTLDVRGGATWSAGQINLNPNSTGTAAAGHIINRSGSVFDTTFNGFLFTQNLSSTDNGADALLTNEAGGTLRKSGGGSTTTVSNIFTNAGTIDIAAGNTLNFDSGGSQTGATTTGTGTLGFTGGTQTLTGMSGTANITMTAGTVTVSGTYAVSGRTTVNGATAIFTGPATTGAFTETSGIVRGTGTLTVTGRADQSKCDFHGHGGGGPHHQSIRVGL
jgi:hypothetical protein